MRDVVVHRLVRMMLGQRRLLLLDVVPIGDAVAIGHHPRLELRDVTLVYFLTSVVWFMVHDVPLQQLSLLVLEAGGRKGASIVSHRNATALEGVRTRRLQADRPQLVLLLLILQLVLLMVETLQYNWTSVPMQNPELEILRHEVTFLVALSNDRRECALRLLLLRQWEGLVGAVMSAIFRLVVSELPRKVWRLVADVVERWLLMQMRLVDLRGLMKLHLKRLLRRMMHRLLVVLRQLARNICLLDDVGEVGVELVSLAWELGRFRVQHPVELCRQLVVDRVCVICTRGWQVKWQFLVTVASRGPVELGEVVALHLLAENFHRWLRREWVAKVICRAFDAAVNFNGREGVLLR